MASFCLLVLCWQVSVGQSQLRHCVLLSGCGGLWWQLLEEMLEVPNVVCRSLCSEVQRASAFQPVS